MKKKLPMYMIQIGFQLCFSGMIIALVGLLVKTSSGPSSLLMQCPELIQDSVTRAWNIMQILTHPLLWLVEALVMLIGALLVSQAVRNEDVASLILKQYQ